VKYDGIERRIKVKDNYKNRKLLFTRQEFIDFGMNDRIDNNGDGAILIMILSFS